MQHVSVQMPDWGGLRVANLEPALARRVLLTVSCTDSEPLPKVSAAGEVIEHDGVRVQVMHNGVLVEEGGYYGDWMAEIIRVLRGHHEPQEELVFARLVDRIGADTGARSGSPAMIELGAFWAYYSLWFCHDIPTARAFGIEPDPAYLEVGRRNVELNGLRERIRLEPGVIGAEPGSTLQFVAESDGVERPVKQYDLSTLMDESGLEHVDLVVVDIQGWELLFIQQALPLLRAGRVRFLLISTHHHSISGNALTHQQVADMLVEAGAHVIAEHTVSESASGDGLIAVSFDPRDDDLHVPVSHVRARDSLFGELEHDLALAQASATTAREQLERAEHELADLRLRLARTRGKVRRLRRRVRMLTDRRVSTQTGPRPRALLSSARRRLRGARRRSAS
jgi:FkbM family methyltransferase